MRKLKVIKIALLLYIAAMILEKVLKRKDYGIKLSVNKKGASIKNFWIKERNYRLLINNEFLN